MRILAIDRDAGGVAHVVALSGGKDSTAMALALRRLEPRPYTYLCTPTGDELPDMIQHWDNIERILNRPILKVTNGTLSSIIEANRMLPNTHARFCTRLLKLKPCDTFMRGVLPAVLYVGLRDDEDEREGSAPGGDFGVLRQDTARLDYPFRRWGWGVEDVLAELRSAGVSIPRRTDCARCPYQTLAEWWRLWRDHPEVWASAEADEERYGHTFRSDKRDTWPAALRDLRKRFEAGDEPTRSFKIEERKGMCRRCSL